MGEHTGALPEGRMASKMLANSLSPCQGRDIKGPTAVVHSATKFDHTLIGNGMVLNIKFHPTALNGEEGIKNFKDLIKIYFDMGGMEIQFNVVDRKILSDARKNPGNYGDLVVRVSGFSAYFTRLSMELQDEIISRTEYSYIDS